MSLLSLAAGTAALLSGYSLPIAPRAASARSAIRMAVDNVAQTQDTSRDKVMTFSYDMSLEPKYEKPTYPGTGNGQGGEEGEYDVVVIGSGMGGLACGALTAKYGDSVCILESHIKVGGSAHTFSRMHNGGKYSFEVGPSIFEGLDKPSYNPLRIVFDILGEEMPVATYTGLGYWTPQGYWRFQIGDAEAAGGWVETLRARATDGDLAVEQWYAFRNRLKVCVYMCQHVYIYTYRCAINIRYRVVYADGDLTVERWYAFRNRLKVCIYMHVYILQIYIYTYNTSV